MADKNIKFVQPPATTEAKPASVTDELSEKRVDFENRQSAAPIGEGSVDVKVRETVGRLYDPADDASLKEDKEHGTFRRDFVLSPEQVMTDCANAVVTEALNAGYRPTGLASVSGSAPHADGHHVVVTWVLPVADQKRLKD